MYTVLNKYYQNKYFKDKVLLKSFEENNNCVSVRIYVKYGGKCRKAKN